MTHSSDAFELERALFSEKGVWFYQVPASQVTSLAPRADAWDPEHPFLTGSVRVLQRGDACFVQLFEPAAEQDQDETAAATATPTLFAQCPLQITRELALDVYVHDCVDSSRYFMLRVEDEQSGRRAFVGIGFPDRTAAFNFKATLQDYAKYALRQLEVEQVEAAEQQQTASSPKKPDLSLPEGATIRINLKTNGGEDGDRAAARRRRSSSGGGGAVSPAKVPLIPPPPGDSPSSAVKVPAIAPPPAVADPTTAVEDEDWGDFTSA
ncbi:Adaptin-like protein [Phytophthora cinnamomi]|uniref:Adaptin-like protein n=1 Tax=Phytophthora cinnamomi TaxID=4785 RepID=UPI00355A7591|nr:Adaptin-like protein [Phytophthora cinnamomi]